MVKRSIAVFSLVVSSALLSSCSGDVSTPISATAGTSTSTAPDCVSVLDAVTVANASNLAKIAARGSETDSASYPYAYTVDSTELLACERGVTVLDTGLREASGEPVPTELHRYLIERNASGQWYDSTREYTVERGDRFVGMDCERLPPKVAAQYRQTPVGEHVTYPSRACVQPTASTTVAPIPGLTVGEVPGQPAAAAALRAWAVDLVAGDMAELELNCWTIAPVRVREMYADPAAIAQALAQPGIDGQFAYVWENSTTRVSVKRSEIASGYACPYVSPQSDVHIYNAEDARHLVVRFLMRVIGQPIDLNDTEARYPLECHEMSETSRSIAETVTAFNGDSIVVSGGPDEWHVVVRGTSDNDEEREYRYITGGWNEGYCISLVE